VKRGPRPLVTLNLPPLEPATASWLFDLCGQLQHEILQKYGDELEAYWTATAPDQRLFMRIGEASGRRPR
jgi:hypothetical protein